MIEIYNGYLPELPAIPQTEEEKQRTAKWYESRKGRFTGSGIKSLMACNRATSKMIWDRAEKIVDFSETAKKYVFEKAMERKRNKVIQTQTSSAMRYGTENEDVIFEMLKKQYPEWNFKKVEFIEFIDGIAGSSPDGEILCESDNFGLEIKASTGWNGLYERHEIDVDQSHKDFWQLQSEMLSLKTNKIMYVVAEPSVNIYEPKITDLSIKFIDHSPIQQNAIKQRCMIGNLAINKFLSGINFHQAILGACSEYNIKLGD